MESTLLQIWRGTKPEGRTTTKYIRSIHCRELERENNALAEALDRIMEYAHDGARIRDVDPQEQPQFIAARAALALRNKQP